MRKPNLKITEKNFIYNLVLTLLISTLIFSYMAFFMPKVYLEKKLENEEENALKVHSYFVKNKNYGNLDASLRQEMYSFYIKDGKNKAIFSSIHYNAVLDIKNKNLMNLLRYMEKDDYKKLDKEEFDSYLEPVMKDLKESINNFAEIKTSAKTLRQSKDTASLKKVNGAAILKFQTSIKDSVATTLIVVSKSGGDLYISIYPYIFNNISNIKSTVISAFPVIFLMIVIIVFLLNRIYSKSITEPIIEMSNFTKDSKYEKNANYDLEIHTNDELEELSENLKSLYESLTENYKKLEIDSKKREIFIKSASHEIKTPLQMAILLNESMINKIGKYKDTDKYLPELRGKLYTIQVLIDDLLYLNRIDQSPTYEDLDLALIMKESVNNHKDLISEKNLSVEILGKK